MATIQETKEAIFQAVRTIHTADEMATLVAKTLVDRLHKVDDATTLRKLKHQLRDFDMTTGKWREK